MAVVNTLSNIAPRAFGGAGDADPQALNGIVRVKTGTVTNGAADSSGSTFYLADLPSDCYLDTSSALDVTDWGFATVSVGTKTDVDALVQVLKSAGNTVSLHAVGDAKHGKALWEVLGLAADPGGTIPLYAHAVAGATGAGKMEFRLAYIHRS